MITDNHASYWEKYQFLFPGCFCCGRTKLPAYLSVFILECPAPALSIIVSQTIEHFQITQIVWKIIVNSYLTVLHSPRRLKSAHLQNKNTNQNSRLWRVIIVVCTVPRTIDEIFRKLRRPNYHYLYKVFRRLLKTMPIFNCVNFIEFSNKEV